MTTTAKILGALAVSAAIMMPHTVFGGSMIRQTDASEISEFAKFLPTLDEVPWLNARSHNSTRLPVSLPEAGTLSALLLIPKPVTTWASLETPSAASGVTVGM